MKHPMLLGCLAFVAWLAPATAAAQQQPTERIGAVSAGTLADLAADSLFHPGRRGATLGAIGGAVSVALWTTIAQHKCTLNVLCLVDPAQPELVLQTLVGAAVGAGVGYLIGRARS